MSITTIVAAVALEAIRDPVVERALQLARQHEARLVFVHALEEEQLDEDLAQALGNPAAIRQALEEQAIEQIKLQIGTREPSLRMDIVVKSGKAYEIINSVAHDHDADLVLIGPGNANNLGERLFGSTADRVVRSVNRPILIVKSLLFKPYKRVMAATDFSVSSNAALQAAARVAPLASLQLIHAVEIPLTFEQAMRRAGSSQVQIDAYRDVRAVAARKQMRAVLDQLEPGFARSRIRLVRGAAAQALAAYSRSPRIDLIVVGTQGRNAVSRALLGSVALSVLRIALCDVLLMSASASDKA